MMKYNLYVLRNLLSGSVEVSRQFPFAYMFPTDLQAGVEIAPTVAQRLDEYQLLRVGSVDLDSGDVFSEVPHVIPWDTRRLRPEVPPVSVRTGTASEIEQQYVADTADTPDAGFSKSFERSV